MCQLAGVRVAYPMLDSAVVDFSLRIPGDWKVRGGELRWFYKRAMRGFLPDRIIDKTKHGFGLPFGPWMRTDRALEELALTSLASLRGRGWVRKEFIDSLLQAHRTGHAAYYGTTIWVAMMLEQWLQARRPA
jgi:asparagine synthase (glutamine-hydrolysing)